MATSANPLSCPANSRALASARHGQLNLTSHTLGYPNAGQRTKHYKHLS